MKLIKEKKKNFYKGKLKETLANQRNCGKL